MASTPMIGTAPPSSIEERSPLPRIGSEEVRHTLGLVQRPRWRRLVWALLGAQLAAGCAFAGVSAWRARAAAAVPDLEVADAKRADVLVTVRATGTLHAMTTVEVGAEVTGRVLTVTADANDPVRKGQVLATIDPEQLQAAVVQAEAQVASAEAAIAQADATATETRLAKERRARMSAEGLANQTDIEATTAAYARARANLASAVAGARLARAALVSAKSHRDKTTIVSPIDGSVLSRLVEPGTTVTAGFQTPILFRLARDLTQMRLTVEIDEADVGRVREGLPASFSVEAFPERRFPSRVISLRNEPKTTQGVVTYEAVLSVDNSERLLRPGMTCTASILSDTRHDVLVVPNAALRFTPPDAEGEGHPAGGAGHEGERRKQVWVLRANVPVALPVATGATDGEVTEIVSGEVPPGTKVVVDVKEPL